MLPWVLMLLAGGVGMPAWCCIAPPETVVLRGILTAKGLDWIEFLPDGQPLDQMRRYQVQKEDEALVAELRRTRVNSRVEIHCVFLNPGMGRVVGLRVLTDKKVAAY